MKRALVFAIALLMLASVGHAATLYENDFSNGSQPPAGWTAVASEGTTSFICDNTTFAPQWVGNISIGGASTPALYTVLDESAGWTDTVLDFDILARDYWIIFEAFVRYESERFSYYSVQFDFPNETIAITKSGTVLDSASYSYVDGDHITISATGGATTTIVVSVNSSPVLTQTQSAGVLLSGQMGFGLLAVQEWGFAAIFLDDIIVTAPESGGETAAPVHHGKKSGIKSIKRFKHFKEVN